MCPSDLAANCVRLHRPTSVRRTVNSHRSTHRCRSSKLASVSNTAYSLVDSFDAVCPTDASWGWTIDDGLGRHLHLYPGLTLRKSDSPRRVRLHAVSVGAIWLAKDRPQFGKNIETVLDDSKSCGGIPADCGLRPAHPLEKGIFEIANSTIVVRNTACHQEIKPHHRKRNGGEMRVKLASQILCPSSILSNTIWYAGEQQCRRDGAAVLSDTFSTHGPEQSPGSGLLELAGVRSLLHGQS
jgi:hypothetical protein